MAEQGMPSVRGRQLARDLRRFREAAELKGKDAAESLGWSTSKISRIESGSVSIAASDLDLLITLYGIPGPVADDLRSMAAKIFGSGWWDAYARTVSASYANLLKLEHESAKVHNYSAAVPHALLLTPDFLRRIILAASQQPSPLDVERRIDINRRRQDVLTRAESPMVLSSVIDEAVFLRLARLDTDEDEAAIIRQQIDHILTLAALPNIRIRVLKLSAGLPPVSTGAFSVLRPFEDVAPDLVCIENKTRVFFIEDRDDVHGFYQDFEKLRGMAMNPADSAALIRDLFPHPST